MTPAITRLVLYPGQVVPSSCEGCPMGGRVSDTDGEYLCSLLSYHEATDRNVAKRGIHSPMIHATFPLCTEADWQEQGRRDLSTVQPGGK